MGVDDWLNENVFYPIKRSGYAGTDAKREQDEDDRIAGRRAPTIPAAPAQSIKDTVGPSTDVDKAFPGYSDDQKSQIKAMQRKMQASPSPSPSPSESQ